MSRNKRPRLEASNDDSFQIPVLQFDRQKNDAAIEDAYRKCQALYIPKISTSTKDALTWKDLGGLFESLDKDKESWCIENGGKVVSPTLFLQAGHVGYSSFLLQKDAPILQNTMKSLPVCKLVKSWSHGSCLWFFFGVNTTSKDTNNEDLQGRPEHTDSVSHDGTWHYQLSGYKRWYLRPTEELLETCPEATSTIIDCHEGDVIVVNTRLWWHRTVIPPQPTPSVSYARDFYIKAAADDGAEGESQQEPMSNVDGLYAANDVECDTIIFTEHDMPDCELPHSSINPNCKVVELDDGSSALVSTRLIRSGEFFCVAEDEESDDDEEDDDKEDDCDES